MTPIHAATEGTKDLPGFCDKHCPKKLAPSGKVCGSTCRNNKGHTGNHLCAQNGHSFSDTD